MVDFYVRLRCWLLLLRLTDFDVCPLMFHIDA
jgi:hypothetical protein